MKVLLDENLPHRLRVVLDRHDVSTTAYMGWAGIKNGQLLAFAEADGFEVFLTADRNMKYQQNLLGRQLALVVLTTQNWEIINLCLTEILEAVNGASAGSICVVPQTGLPGRLSE